MSDAGRGIREGGMPETEEVVQAICEHGAEEAMLTPSELHELIEEAAEEAVGLQIDRRLTGGAPLSKIGELGSLMEKWGERRAEVEDMEDGHEWFNSSHGIDDRIKNIRGLYKTRRMLPKIGGTGTKRQRAKDKNDELQKDFAAKEKRHRSHLSRR
eukprot:2001401-Prymnesium_polylepis.1